MSVAAEQSVDAAPPAMQHMPTTRVGDVTYTQPPALYTAAPSVYSAAPQYTYVSTPYTVPVATMATQGTQIGDSLMMNGNSMPPMENTMPPMGTAASPVDDEVTTQIAASAAVSEAPANMAFDQASEAPSLAPSATHSTAPAIYPGVPTTTSFAAAPMLPVHQLAPGLFNGQVQFKFTAADPSANAAETEAPPATRAVKVAKKKRACC